MVDNSKSPIVFKSGQYRFFFFSREETRMRVHAIGSDGEAKFWIEPKIKLAMSRGFSSSVVNPLEKLVTEMVTSKAEIVQVTPFGIWLAYEGREFFLDYDRYPWFKNATVDKIYHVEVPVAKHLYWPELDIDLELECLENPDRYPLVAK